jgi:hypothetical protein
MLMGLSWAFLEEGMVAITQPASQPSTKIRPPARERLTTAADVLDFAHRLMARGRVIERFRVFAVPLSLSGAPFLTALAAQYLAIRPETLDLEEAKATFAKLLAVAGVDDDAALLTWGGVQIQEMFQPQCAFHGNGKSGTMRGKG